MEISVETVTLCEFGVMCGVMLFLFVAARWCTGLLTASIGRAPRPAEGAAEGGQSIGTAIGSRDHAEQMSARPSEGRVSWCCEPARVRSGGILHCLPNPKFMSISSRPLHTVEGVLYLIQFLYP